MFIMDEAISEKVVLSLRNHPNDTAIYSSKAGPFVGHDRTVAWFSYVHHRGAEKSGRAPREKAGRPPARIVCLEQLVFFG